jgi:hypothetical protein
MELSIKPTTNKAGWYTTITPNSGGGGRKTASLRYMSPFIKNPRVENAPLARARVGSPHRKTNKQNT